MNLSEINKEIDYLEHNASSYSDCEKLSVLYNIKNNLAQDRPSSKAMSYSSAPAASEFLAVAQALDAETLLSVLDEHMDVVRVVFPKEYNAVIQKLKELR